MRGMGKPGFLHQGLRKRGRGSRGFVNGAEGRRGFNRGLGRTRVLTGDEGLEKRMFYRMGCQIGMGKMIG